MTQTQPLTDQQMCDLLSNAFEGGSAHWCKCLNKTKPSIFTFEDEYQPTTPYPYEYPLSVGGSLLLAAMDEDGGTMEEFGERVLDREALLRGAELLRTKYPEHYADAINENADATTGDVFLQLCILGDVVFG